FGTPEFEAAYLAAVQTVQTVPTVQAGATGTLAWLIARYRETTAWTTLALITRRKREYILRYIIDRHGAQAVARITAATIRHTLDAKPTPAAQKHFLDTARGLFAWAHGAGLTRIDPTAGIKVKQPKTAGYRPWTEEDIAAYEARWPLGTRQRVWLD